MVPSKVSLSRTLLPNLFAAITAVTAGTYGCSSENPNQGVGGTGGSGDPSGAGGTSSSSMASSGSGGGSATCMGPGFPAGTPRLVDSVQATLVDFNGAPLPNLAIQVCGTDICFNDTTNATGQVLVNAASMMTKPALKYADGIVYARFGILLPPESVVMFPTPLEVARFPDLGMGAPLTAGQSATSGDVTITVAAGATVEIDTLIHDDPAEQDFRSVTIPIAKASPGVDPSLNLELLFAVTPLETLFCPAAAVSVPNSAGWPAGTDVEFHVHGLEIGEEWAPYGGWAKASDGKVSADGTKVETATGGGLHILGDFGIRRK